MARKFRRLAIVAVEFTEVASELTSDGIVDASGLVVAEVLQNALASALDRDELRGQLDIHSLSFQVTMLENQGEVP